MGCLQPGASLINLPAQSPNLAYYYPQAGDTDIYCMLMQIELKITPQEATQMRSSLLEYNTLVFDCNVNTVNMQQACQ